MVPWIVNWGYQIMNWVIFANKQTEMLFGAFFQTAFMNIIYGIKNAAKTLLICYLIWKKWEYKNRTSKLNNFPVFFFFFTVKFIGKNLGPMWLRTNGKFNAFYRIH
jgi:hypothetical protein